VDPEAAGAAAGDVLEPATEPAAPRALPAEPADPDDVPDGLVAAAELIVFDALSRAGGRLLTREHRGRFGSTQKHDLYRSVPYDGAGEGVVERLLADSFQFAGHVAAGAGRDPERLEFAIREHVTNLLTHKLPHSRSALVRMIGHYA
jgi:hypothetical protein